MVYRGGTLTIVLRGVFVAVIIPWSVVHFPAILVVSSMTGSRYTMLEPHLPPYPVLYALVYALSTQNSEEALSLLRPHPLYLYHVHNFLYQPLHTLH